MTPAEILGIRNGLHLTQVQLAQLLGVHPLTVSKWERGLALPSAHERALLESFGKAANAQPDVGEAVVQVLVRAGVVLALFVLLKAAFESE